MGKHYNLFKNKKDMTMSKNRNTLAANARAKAGKGAARAVRREGNIPAVIYGDNKEPVLISVSEKELKMVSAKKGFFTQLCDLSLDGQKHLVLPREIQVHPVTDRPEHADFLRVSEKTIIRASVPVRVSNEKGSPGLTKGGVLNLVRHEIEVFCRATEIPVEFIADLTGLDVGSSLHVDALGLPEGVKTVMPGNFTVITLVAPSAMKSEDVAAAPGADAAAAAAPAAAAGGKAPAAAAAPAKDAKKK